MREHVCYVVALQSVQLGHGKAVVVVCMPLSVLGLGLSCVWQHSLYHNKSLGSNVSFVYD